MSALEKEQANLLKRSFDFKDSILEKKMHYGFLFCELEEWFTFDPKILILRYFMNNDYTILITQLFFPFGSLYKIAIEYIPQKYVLFYRTP